MFVSKVSKKNPYPFNIFNNANKFKEKFVILI